MGKTVRRLTAACLMVAACGAQAGFTVSDSAFGEDTLVFQEETGLRWLRLDQTRGRSYTEVAQELGSTYRGFSIASGEQVSDLFASLHIAPESGLPPATPWTAEGLAESRQVLRWYGAVEEGERTVLRGFSNYGGPATYDEATGFTGSPFLQGTGAYIGPNYAAYFDDAAPFFKPAHYADYGTFLVTAPVPEPETWALMGVGLFAVVARRRAKAKQAA